ncbi:GNAT family N-acetyltransferase [Streptomyces sp. NPDC090306]|uniref:GNAT family N-acetyltransferase n=1 Tax=Streptomyces sp. NPDC090306 TaxID=3365961 RepID=UPI003817E73A
MQPAAAPSTGTDHRTAPGRPPLPGGDGAEPAEAGEPRGGEEDTLELRLPPGGFGCPASGTGAADLLDDVGNWGEVISEAGALRLVPVVPERELALLARWMNDPAVAAFWELDGPGSRTLDHVRAQLDGDGRSVPCLGVLDGRPMSYWELYRADLDPLARHYPARPHDTGVHLLLGDAADRGRGLGTALLGAVAALVLDRRPACTRVVAEPDVRNTSSVAAFLGAGFRRSAELDLPDKRAALMIRERSARPAR